MPSLSGGTIKSSGSGWKVNLLTVPPPLLLTVSLMSVISSSFIFFLAFFFSSTVSFLDLNLRAAMSCISCCLLFAARNSGVAGAIFTGDLARGLPRPVDGPGISATATLVAPEADASSISEGCCFGVLVSWLHVRPVEDGSSVLKLNRMAVLLMMVGLELFLTRSWFLLEVYRQTE